MICYIVQAHHQPRHFHRLVEKLTEHGDVVVAHIDATADQTPFETENPRVSFVTDRVNVKWGGFSQVRAGLALLRAARSRHPEASHVWYISGDCYPMRDPRSLREMLEAHPGRQLINILPLPTPEMGKPITRLSRLWIEHDPRSNPLALGFKVIQRVVPQPYKRSLEGMTPFCGSTWFALTADAVDAVLTSADERRRFTRLCTHTLCSDEHYFHTLLGNSPFADDTAPVGMFTDFVTPPGPWPCVLGPAQIQKITETAETGDISGYGQTTVYFARKFTEESGPLLDTIEEQLWPLPITEPARAAAMDTALSAR